MDRIEMGKFAMSPTVEDDEQDGMLYSRHKG
jgi:hypothetical protein